MHRSPTRSTILRGTALAASLLLVLGASAVSAASAKNPPTTITITIDFEAAVAETFTATGPVLCPSGTAVSTQEHFGGNFVVVGTFHLFKVLTCADNPANTLTINVDAGATFKKGGSTGGWSVAGGTGAFAGLHGGGSIKGVSQDGNPIDLIDYYTGQVH